MMIHSAEQTTSETLQISVPSKETMFQYLIHLTEKFQQLEKKNGKNGKNGVFHQDEIHQRISADA